MKVTYSINGKSEEFDTVANDDLSEIAKEIEERLRSDNESLADVPQLPIRVADSVLNSLAEDGEEITLGEVWE